MNREDAIIARVNGMRRMKGKRPLVRDPRLDKLAQDQADRMAKGGYLDHRGFEGRVGGWKAWIGEVIYKATTGSQLDSANAVVSGWKSSNKHREILLYSYAKLIGVGRAEGRKDAFYTAVVGEEEG